MPFEGMPNMAERPKAKLDNLMSQLSKKINTDLGEEILTPDASVDFKKWEPAYGGEEIDDDERMIRNKRLMWSSATNEGTRKFYKQQNNWSEEGEELTQKIVNKYLENRESSNPALLEKAVMVVFHKILGEKFLVMRSSVHDDYENGVDNIIVNKETGDVICAFDEVHGETKHGRIDDKKAKMLRKAQDGGADIKYGLTFEEGGKKLVKKQIENVPDFYLSLEPRDLQNLLANLNSDLGSRPSDVELKIFDNFILSLEEQIDVLSKVNIPFKVKKNIDSFKKSMVEIKKLRKNFD
jgi:hypothetical protein